MRGGVETNEKRRGKRENKKETERSIG